MLLKFLPIEIGNAFRCKQCVGQGKRVSVCVCMCVWWCRCLNWADNISFLIRKKLANVTAAKARLMAWGSKLKLLLESSVSCLWSPEVFSSSVAMPFRVSCCIFMRAKLCSITFFIMNNGYKMPEQNKSKGGQGKGGNSNGSNSRESNNWRLLHHMSSKQRVEGRGGSHIKRQHTKCKL